MISELRQKYPLKDLLKLSGLARSTYYYYLKQPDEVYLSPVLDLYNNEIVSCSISTSPNLEQIRQMLGGLFEKLPADATPVFHSDQGWQYQHAEYRGCWRSTT